LIFGLATNSNGSLRHAALRPDQVQLKEVHWIAAAFHCDDHILQRAWLGANAKNPVIRAK
jgi:hypothetical protein